MPVRHFFGDLFRRLRRDERGNVFVLFGASAIPLLLIMGGAVDFARYARYKADLSNAVDSASLALAREHPDYSAADAKTFVTNYVNAMDLADNQLTISSFDAVKNTNGFTVTATGAMKTMFLPLGKFAKNGNAINSMGLNITASVVNSSNRVEVALVMDNPGSMNCAASLGSCVSDWAAPASNSRIVAVKAAAKTLVDILMPDNLDDKDLVKIAIVPFEGQVNVASSGFDVDNPPSWIDWADYPAGTAGPTWEGMNFGKRNTSTGATCTTGAACKYVGHKWLFGQIKQRYPTVKWAGCVEMRAGSYELSDAAPSTSIPDSLYVPFFSPDEPDSSTTAGSSGVTRYNYDSNGSSTGGTQYTYQNDYLSDRVAGAPATIQKSWDKYKYQTVSSVNYPKFWTGRMDVEGLLSPYEYGPNRGCPRPIYPLANANSKTAIKAEIDSMIAYWSSGTFLPTGLVWGWHVVSPGIPYTQGTKAGDQ
jgi:Flp pilus assembly protein TadG